MTDSTLPDAVPTHPDAARDAHEASSTKVRNVAGLIALALGVIAVVVGMSSYVVTLALVAGAATDASAIGGVNLVFSVLVLLVGLAAVIVGIVGLLRRRKRVAAAAAGTALGAAAVVQTLFPLAVGLVFNAL